LCLIWDPCLGRHIVLLNYSFSCGEQAFQAAKLEREEDVRVLLTYKKAQEAAEVGRGKLPVKEELAYLFRSLELELNLVSVASCSSLLKTLETEAGWRVGKASCTEGGLISEVLDGTGSRILIVPNAGGEECVYVRLVEMRKNWDLKLKYLVMSHVQHERFWGRNAQPSASRIYMILSGWKCFFVEHKKRCQIWADGIDVDKGMVLGNNALGKCINICHKSWGSLLSDTEIECTTRRSDVDVNYNRLFS
jgi:hypothetical protein